MACCVLFLLLLLLLATSAAVYGLVLTRDYVRDVKQYNAATRLANFTNESVVYIQEDAFLDMASLEELYLGANLLRMLNVSHFASLQHLTIVQVLSLRENEITVIDDDTFQHIMSLTHLDLSRNALTSVDSADMFKGLLSLEWLTLAFNRLRTIGDGSFQHLLRLVRLELQGNQLHVLTGLTFYGLYALTSLDLNSNELSEVTSFQLQVMPELNDLYLDSNKLSLFQAGQSALRRLEMSHNQLNESIFTTSHLATSLVILKLNNNSIGLLSNHLGSFSSLEELHVASNAIALIESENAFQGLTWLKVLNLNKNELSTLPQNSLQKANKS